MNAAAAAAQQISPLLNNSHLSHLLPVLLNKFHFCSVNDPLDVK